MFRPSVFICLLTILVSCQISLSQSAYTLADPKHYIYKEVEKIIVFDTPIRNVEVPGMVIGMIDHDSTWILSIGYQTLDKKKPIPIDARFEIGSVTKLILAGTISALVGQGKLDWNWPINKILPPTCQNPILDQISISDLASHQSGLPKLPSFIGNFEMNAQNPFSEYQKEDLCNYIQTLKKLEVKSGIYSHVNYALLEIGLEYYFKSSLQSLMEENLFNALQMEQTTLETKDALTEGYTLGMEKAERQEFASFAGSEGMTSTIPDLIQFCKWQLGVGSFNKVPSGKDIQNEIGRSNLGQKVNTSRGWHMVYPKKKREVLMQTGKSSGHHAAIAILPQTKTGVIILSNASFGSFDLSYLILRMMNKNWRRKS